MKKQKIINKIIKYVNDNKEDLLINLICNTNTTRHSTIIPGIEYGTSQLLEIDQHCNIIREIKTENKHISKEICVNDFLYDILKLQMDNKNEVVERYILNIINEFKEVIVKDLWLSDDGWLNQFYNASDVQYREFDWNKEDLTEKEFKKEKEKISSLAVNNMVVFMGPDLYKKLYQFSKNGVCFTNNDIILNSLNKTNMIILTNCNNLILGTDLYNDKEELKVSYLKDCEGECKERILIECNIFIKPSYYYGYKIILSGIKNN